jgi:iduronate 2-sulfatase
MFKTFLLAAAAAVSAAAEPVARTNVLLICVDDLKPALGCYGDPHARSPQIDRLAAQGTLFRHAYVQQAVCAPSRNTLFTGLRPDQLGIYDLATFFRAARPDCQTLPQRFQAQGWHTACVGKGLHRSHNNSDDPANWSVKPWYPTVGPGMARMREQARVEGKSAAWAAPDFADEEMADHQIASEAGRLLGGYAESGTPFFLVVGFLEPHLPFIAPKRWWDRIDVTNLLVEDSPTPVGAPPFALPPRLEVTQYGGFTGPPIDPATARTLTHGYYACTAFVDAQVGRVMEALDRHRLRERTVVVLWGDHGFHLGDHGQWGKHTNFEQAARNPLIISAPGRRPGVADGLAATTDLYPTLCSLAGLEVPAGLPGRSLVPLLDDPAASVQDAVFHVYPRGSVLGRAVRTASWRYVEWRRWEDGSVQARELYDLVGDARETRNLADDPAWAAARAEGARRLAALGDPAPQVKAPARPGKG